MWLKQELYNGRWTLFYTRSVRGEQECGPADSYGRIRITVHEGFFWMSELIARGHIEHNTTPEWSWVRQIDEQNSSQSTVLCLSSSFDSHKVT